MITADLQAQLGFCHFCIVTNLEEITEAQAMQEPGPAGNPVNRVLGHIVGTRRGIFGILGLEHPWQDDQAAVYDVAWVDADKSRALPLSELIELELKTFAQIKTAVMNFTGNWDEHWPGSSSERPQTYGQRVQFFMLHEAYHAGQLGILRRSLGLPGKI